MFLIVFLLESLMEHVSLTGSYLVFIAHHWSEWQRGVGCPQTQRPFQHAGHRRSQFLYCLRSRRSCNSWIADLVIPLSLSMFSENLSIPGTTVNLLCCKTRRTSSRLSRWHTLLGRHTQTCKGRGILLRKAYCRCRVQSTFSSALLFPG